MNCVDCPHFRILFEPIKGWDLGRSACEKYDMVCDFASRRKLNTLKCVEKQEEEDGGGEK